MTQRENEWEKYNKNITDLSISRGFSKEDLFILLDEVEKIPQNGTYVEIGVSEGSSIIAVSQFRPDIKCYGIEINVASLSNKATTAAKSLGLNNVELIFGQGAEIVCKSWDKDIDLLFIDGRHYFPNIFWDYVGWSPFVKNGGTIAFHDIEGPIGPKFEIGIATQIFLGHPKYKTYFPAIDDIISSSMFVLKK